MRINHRRFERGPTMAIERRMISGYLPLRQVMNQLFEGSFISPESVGGQGTFPPVDVYVTDDDVVVEMGLPGGNPDNLNISVAGDALIISGEVKRQRETEKAHPYVQEIWQGKFHRSFTLPMQVDATGADASFADGILTLRLSKSEAAKPHKIRVERKPQTITTEHYPAIEGGVHTEAVPVR
jgi:HSP20 family protein